MLKFIIDFGSVWFDLVVCVCAERERRRNLVNFHKFELRRHRSLHRGERAHFGVYLLYQEWCKECARFCFLPRSNHGSMVAPFPSFHTWRHQKPTEPMRQYRVMILGRGEMKSNSHLTSTLVLFIVRFYVMMCRIARMFIGHSFNFILCAKFCTTFLYFVFLSISG